ncbi:CvpA family protein [Buchnera aphidicola]|uniref:Colicin V production protein n=1 Tax=Buchnera aphidicola subsp. Rhopalosiphum maidis TaxID=118109 RepID=A0A3G2I625_BUCRM|nr:hypothetical protein D8S97_02920 [Buchnera aphidicola (Rhopalosiphum maidis)]
MTFIDYVILFIIFISVSFGLFRGFIQEVISFVLLFFSIYFFSNYYYFSSFYLKKSKFFIRNNFFL